jgi:hypothetical protein
MKPGHSVSDLARKNVSASKMRERNPAWIGGTVKDGLGYVLVKNRQHPFCNWNGYVREHRLVMEKHLGRYLLPSEVVHHENEIKTDNRIENLRLFKNKAEHQKYHKSVVAD